MKTEERTKEELEKEVEELCQRVVGLEKSKTELEKEIDVTKHLLMIIEATISTLNSDEILETVTRMVAKVIPCDRTTIALVNKEKGGFTYAAGFGIEFLPKKTIVLFEDSSTTEVVVTGEPQYIKNLKEVKGIRPLEEKFLKEGFFSHIRVPLKIKGEVIGVLSVGAKKTSAFTSENLSTLEKLASQVSVALENARLVSDLEELSIGTVKSLSSAIDAKSNWTAGHSVRVAKYSLEIGKEMGLTEKELKNLELAALLHDVGKIGTYEAILDKQSKFVKSDITIMRAHPAAGANILSPIKQLKDVIPGVRHHHENYDGTGYPDGLKGEEIPLLARIIAVSDAYDAMKADRPYRKGKDIDSIIAELKKRSGTQFDPKVIEVVLKIAPRL